MWPKESSVRFTKAPAVGVKLGGHEGLGQGTQVGVVEEALAADDVEGLEGVPEAGAEAGEALGDEAAGLGEGEGGEVGEAREGAQLHILLVQKPGEVQGFQLRHAAQLLHDPRLHEAVVGEGEGPGGREEMRGQDSGESVPELVVGGEEVEEDGGGEVADVGEVERLQVLGQVHEAAQGAGRIGQAQVLEVEEAVEEQVQIQSTSE